MGKPEKLRTFSGSYLITGLHFALTLCGKLRRVNTSDAAELQSPVSPSKVSSVGMKMVKLRLCIHPYTWVWHWGRAAHFETKLKNKNVFLETTDWWSSSLWSIHPITASRGRRNDYSHQQLCQCGSRQAGMKTGRSLFQPVCQTQWLSSSGCPNIQPEPCLVAVSSSSGPPAWTLPTDQCSLGWWWRRLAC